MKNKKLAKLRYNMWFYFIFFAIIIIAIIWIFQILLFDSIYQNRKQTSLSNKGKQLTQLLNTDEPINDQLINNWLKCVVEANEAGMFSYLSYTNEKGEQVTETIYSGFITSSNPSNSVNLSTTINEKDYNAIINAVNRLEIEKINEVCYRLDDEERAEDSIYVYASTVNNALISDGFLIIITSQTDLLNTIDVIQTQLLVVSVFVICIAFFLAWYLSTKLSKPIIEMSQTAKKWAHGDENVSFVGDSYQELSELADTLNYAKDGISQTGLLQRDLLANVSHDLKTPLTMIRAYAEMIRDLSGDIKVKRDAHTQVIIDESDRLTMLVNDILDLSKLQNKVDEMEVATINFSELCNRVLHRFSDFAERSGYKIEKDIEENLFVCCDEKKIEQVIYNLVGNSINYTGEDKTILVKASRQGEFIMFESIDSGKGISKDKIDTIWEKYYRFADTHQRPIKGTGLGLSIVKSILQAHNLKFGVISKKNVGSNFFIQFKEVKGE